MSLTTFMSCARVVLITALLWPICSQSSALDIQDYPLFLTSVGVAPNIIMTIDDSISMQSPFVPENVDDITKSSGCSSTTDSGDKCRLFASSSINGLYYNPKISYQIPTRSDKPTAPYSTSFTKAWYNGFDPSRGPSGGLNLSKAYGVVKTSVAPSDSGIGTTIKGPMVSGVYPAFYYMFYSDISSSYAIPAGCSGASDKLNSACYVPIIVGSSSDVSKGINSSGMPGTGSVAEKQQNFANWYSFYRSRALATMSAAMIAVNGLKDNSIRFGWQTLDAGASNKCPITGSTCPTYGTAKYDNRLKVLDAAQKTIFWNWLERATFEGYTPTRGGLNRVGAYYMTSIPYDDNPNSGPPTPLENQRTCRGNFHILFTDGRWNSAHDSDYKTPAKKPELRIENLDSSSFDLDVSTTLTDGTIINSYTPRSPYQDKGSSPPAPDGGTAGFNSPYNSNSLADTALYYWKTDLSSELNNNVSANYSDLSGTQTQQFWNPKNDPATWQHMVNFTIGLGLKASLVANCLYNTGSSPTFDPNKPYCPVWGGDTYLGDYSLLTTGKRNWPQINQNPTVLAEPDGHIYDLWHAAINSRGKFYSADDPEQLNKAFQDVVNTISGIANAGGGSGVSSNVVRVDTTTTDATAFVATFGNQWIGMLQAFPIDVNGNLGSVASWEAGSLIPPGNLPDSAPPYQRKIFTRNGGTAQELANCTSDLLTALNKNPDGTVDSTLCPRRLAWLRGFTAITNVSWSASTLQATFTAPNHALQIGDSVEVSGVKVTGITPDVLNNPSYKILSVPDPDTFIVVATTDPGGSYDSASSKNARVQYNGFRKRTTVLGDIVDSGTVYVYKDNFGYDDASIKKVEGAGTSYSAYVAGKAANWKPVVYVGANDGMLHAFNAEISGTNAGKELFAYVPAGVYDHLSILTDPTYPAKSHKFFVDGTPTIGDAYIDGAWKTYLVGGLRAGGKSIYALDISNIFTISGFTASDVKWEFTDADLGLTFGQPQIVAIGEKKWAAIFGNGYNSASEKAYLYIIDLATGSLIAKIGTNSDSSNGLSTPLPFDKNGDGVVDVIYAGDLQGNLWKFEKNSTGTWVLGNGSTSASPIPLFKAKISSTSLAQSITIQPKALLISGKVWVYFGTGRYLEPDDLTSNDVQTFYGIRDDDSKDTVPRTDTALLKQTILSSKISTSLFGVDSRAVSQNTLTTDKRGCYLDFPTPTTGQPSERMSSSPLVKTFNTLETRIIFTTSVPPTDPCVVGGESWLMELSTSCGRLEVSPFDLNGDAKFDKSDAVTIATGVTGSISGGKLQSTVSGTSKPIGIVNQITWVEGPGSKGIAYKFLPGSSGVVKTISQSSDIVNPGGPPKRVSWEQIK